MLDDGLQAAEHVVRVLNGTLADIVCLCDSVVHDLLCLCICLLNNAVCFCICTLHDLMLIDQLIGRGGRLGYHRVCLGTCLLQNRILVADDLLIFLDLLRNAKTQFHEQFFNLFFIY